MSSNAAVVEKREPLVKFYKNRSKGGNGAMATTTTATSDDEFLRACADELPVLLEHLVGDEEHTLLEVLPQICEIWAKLRGYKAETIFERRMLIAGEPTPEASMAWVNAPPVD